MRILSGTARGRVLRPPQDPRLRPTTDRVRLAVFNAVGALVPGSMFLDLFCGSGSMGLEALSRGARGAVFVDSRRAFAESAKAAALGFGFPEAAVGLECADFRRALAALKGRGLKADLAYVDPPYDAGLGEDALRLLVSEGLMAATQDMRILYEHAGEAASPEIPGLRLYRRYDHGAASVSAYGP